MGTGRTRRPWDRYCQDCNIFFFGPNLLCRGGSCLCRTLLSTGIGGLGGSVISCCLLRMYAPFMVDELTTRNRCTSRRIAELQDFRMFADAPQWGCTGSLKSHGSRPRLTVTELDISLFTLSRPACLILLRPHRHRTGGAEHPIAASTIVVIIRRKVGVRAPRIISPHGKPLKTYVSTTVRCAEIVV